VFGRSGGIRTPDRRFWRPLLYRAELRSCAGCPRGCCGFFGRAKRPFANPFANPEKQNRKWRIPYLYGILIDSAVIEPETECLIRPDSDGRRSLRPPPCSPGTRALGPCSFQGIFTSFGSRLVRPRTTSGHGLTLISVVCRIPRHGLDRRYWHPSEPDQHLAIPVHCPETARHRHWIQRLPCRIGTLTRGFVRNHRSL
jgi:hypothetical protein